ncbi:MAG: Uma2 family endonuclease [Chloroflexaceae bacterium]|jgi:Uma2 family endonuclease|nr:Uma2 family endonuclease [Chloroflexaceae bacterium]
MTVEIIRHQLHVADYARMLETGILREDDRVELIDGAVRGMSPISPLHAAIVRRLNVMLSQQIPQTITIAVQDPIQLNDYTEPQPDIALLHYRADYYAQAHPVADDVILVVEVADSSLAYDRDEKLPRYAAAQIGEVWLVNIPDRTVEQYTKPRGDKYLVKRIWEAGDNVVADTLPAVSVDVTELFL